MKPQLSEIEALLNEQYFASKVDMIPASLKSIYSAIEGKDVLIARELIINDRVMLGVEYSPDGVIAGAYTTDRTGKRVRVESSDEKTDNHTSRNLISERLDEIAQALSRNEEHQTSVSEQQPDKNKNGRKTVVRKPLTEEKIRQTQLNNYNKNRRGC